MPDRNISLKLNTKLNLFPQEQQQDRLCLHLWNKKKKKIGLSGVLRSLQLAAYLLTPCTNALLHNFCFITVSFLNCSGDKSCLCGGTLLSTGPMEFHNLQNVHQEKN